tara:strand:- start:691 stop:1272 length:582 start_codon:yes stop_codon:yes gene_type:complete
MNYSFEYIDIILLAMIAGFIFLRLRGILGKKTGFEDNISNSFPHEVSPKKATSKIDAKNFDENAKKEFLKGAKIAYETIITNFASGDLNKIKSLLDIKVFDQFRKALSEREKMGLVSDTTFIGINSATILDHKENNNFLEVSVDFVSEIISCVRDKDKKVVSGDPGKIKKVHDTWKFSKDVRSSNPNWSLIET